MKAYIWFCVLAAFVISCNSTTVESVNSQSNSISGDYQLISKTPAKDRKLENLDITIEIAGMPKGSYYLMGYYQDQYFLVDSTRMVSDKINFKLNRSLDPGLYFALFPDKVSAVQMLIDEDQQFVLKSNINDITQSMEVNGSQENQLLFDAFKYESNQQGEFSQISEVFQKFKPGTPEHDEAKAKNDKLSKERMDYLSGQFKKYPTTLFSAFKEAGQNPYIPYDFNPDGTLTAEYTSTLRKLYWENVNFADDRLLHTPVISNKLEKFFTSLIPQNADTINSYATKLVDKVLDKPEYFKYLANWIVLKFEPTKTSLMDAEAVYVHMIQKYFTKERVFWADTVQTYGLQMRAYEMAASLVGLKAPEVSAKGADGKMYNLYDIKSDYIVVFMWNPDCEHCAEETPKLLKYYAEKTRKEFEVYGIVVNTEDAKWRAALAKYKMPWFNVFDPTNRAIYAKYYVDNTPEIYVINPERKIIAKNIKVNQIETVIQQDKAKR